MARILWINPVGTAAYDAPIGAELRAEAAPGTRVDVCSLPGVGRQHLEWNALEAVVAGPTMGVIGFYRVVQRKIGVPVIDAITAPLRYAEFLATLGADHGWRTSRAGGYESVAPRELAWIPVVEPVLNVDPR